MNRKEMEMIQFGFGGSHVGPGQGGYPEAPSGRQLATQITAIASQLMQPGGDLSTTFNAHNELNAHRAAQTLASLADAANKFQAVG
jgi:hypothetical protein